MKFCINIVQVYIYFARKWVVFDFGHASPLIPHSQHSSIVCVIYHYFSDDAINNNVYVIYTPTLFIILLELILMQSHHFPIIPKYYIMYMITYPQLSLLPLHLILICNTLLPSLNFHHLTLHSLLNSLNITRTSLCRSHDILTIRIDNFDLPF